jgi:lipopolysaccharide biosynthesis glycosyltransferase
VLDVGFGYDEAMFSLYFKNNFKILDCRFNLMDYKNTLQKFHPAYTDEYVENEWKHLVIRHFSGSDKPWKTLRNVYNGQILKNYYAFWFYAKMTPFYEGIQNKLLFLCQSQNITAEKRKIKYKLFHCIPLLTVHIKNNVRRYKLFGFIPFLKAKIK